MRSLNFGIDFDGTFTEDPDLWYEFFELAHTLGHKTYIITMRNEDFEGEYLHDYIGEKVDGIIFTSRHGKREYVKEHYNLDIDIWIDDHPHWVVTDHPTLDDMTESIRKHEAWINRNGKTMRSE